MESNLSESSGTTTGLSLDQKAIACLEISRRWAHFLSIMGFIGIGLMILIGFFIGTIMDNYGGRIGSLIYMKSISIVYVLIAAVYFFPVLSLYRFAVNLKPAIYESNSERLTRSFENLKLCFRYLGVITIVVLSIYLIIIISAVVFAMVKSM